MMALSSPNDGFPPLCPLCGFHALSIVRPNFNSPMSSSLPYRQHSQFQYHTLVYVLELIKFTMRQIIPAKATVILWYMAIHSHFTSNLKFELIWV